MATNWRNCIYLATGELKCKTIEHFVDPKECCQNKKHNGLFSPSCVMCIKAKKEKEEVYRDAANIFDPQ